MKVIKAMKKLKFWSRKKRKRKQTFAEHPPPQRPAPPPPCIPYYYPVQPSAPPLPDWFEYEQTQETIFISEASSSASSGSASSSQDKGELSSEQDVDEVRPECTPLLARRASYHPVYEDPILAESRKERAGGAFGCVITAGSHLFRCFFPCFHIRELR